MTRAGRRAFLTVFTLAALGALIALGVWQLQRRDWKNALIARFETALTEQPRAYEPPRAGGNRAREFARVRADGVFLPQAEVKVSTPAPEAARAHTQENFGYLLFTPLKFDGGIVFVNRGFVPQSLSGRTGFLPQGTAGVTGILRLPEEPNWFTFTPDPAKRLFYIADIRAMAAATGLDKDGAAILSEYIQEEPRPGGPQWPLARDPGELLASIPNRHLEYAVTWFGLALALAGVYGVYMLRD